MIIFPLAEASDHSVCKEVIMASVTLEDVQGQLKLCAWSLEYVSYRNDYELSVETCEAN